MGFGIESQYVTAIRLGLDSFQLDTFASFTIVSMQLWYGYVQKLSINVIHGYQQWRPTKKASYKVPSSQLQELKLQHGLSDSKYVCAEEKLAIFLHFAQTGASSRMLQERFQRSSETISK